MQTLSLRYLPFHIYTLKHSTFSTHCVFPLIYNIHSRIYNTRSEPTSRVVAAFRRPGTLSLFTVDESVKIYIFGRAQTQPDTLNSPESIPCYNVHFDIIKIEIVNTEGYMFVNIFR